MLGTETDLLLCFEGSVLWEDKRLHILPTSTGGRKQKGIDGTCLGTPDFSQQGCLYGLPPFCAYSS